MPLKMHRSWGAYCIESPRYSEPTEVAKAELRRLAELRDPVHPCGSSTRRSRCTPGKAIGDLRDLLNRARFPRLARPHMFIAFPGRGDPAVTDTIKGVLHQFRDNLEFTDWSEMYESGNIGRADRTRDPRVEVRDLLLLRTGR